VAPKESGLLNTNNNRVEVHTIMRALDPEVAEMIWRTVEPLIPRHEVSHPLGCHRQRASDRACFTVILVRLATGCSWQDAERLCGSEVSDTTVRARRDEWIDAGVFEAIAEEAISGYDRVIGLDLNDVAVDGSLHKSPCGGEGTGPNPTDRGKLGWKWSILTDLNGIPIGWTIDGANRNDSILLAPTLDNAAGRGLLAEINTLWLDRGYDSDVTRQRLAERGIDDAVIAKKRKPKSGQAKKNQPMGLRWPVERTNSWLSNFGQLRRNTDRKPIHRLAQFALAVAVLLTAKLIDWRNRWSPDLSPIR
jgi:transposase